MQRRFILTAALAAVGGCALWAAVSAGDDWQHAPIALQAMPTEADILADSSLTAHEKAARISAYFMHGSKIENGQPVESKIWPSTVTFVFGKKLCTATVIGPRTVLTAAHCLRNMHGDLVDYAKNAAIGRAGFAATVDCTAFPAYRTAAQERDDIALCRPTAALPSDWGKFETLITDWSSVPDEHSPMLLLGYGCLTVGTESDGTLAFGDAEIASRPPNSQVIIAQSRLLPSGSNGVRVCGGDSGGGAYVVQNGQRRVFAIAVSVMNTGKSHLAEIARYDSGAVVAWMKTWARGDPICGLTGETIKAKCHD